MDNEEFVPREIYQAILAGEFALLQQLITTVSAMVSVLLQAGVVTPDSWKQAYTEAQSSDQARKVREVVEKLRGKTSVEDILKDFQGPIQ